jgi:hypothetical protein
MRGGSEESKGRRCAPVAARRPATARLFAAEAAAAAEAEIGGGGPRPP